MLISVHLPKTAGISFRCILQQHFGRRLRLDYPVYPTSKARSLNTLRLFTRFPIAKCVHGHFPASRYRGKLITFVRNPIEMRISKYYYILREQAKGNHYENNADWNLARQVELDEFMAAPEIDFSKHIDVPADKFSFVGHMENFETDVESFCDHFLGKRYTIPKENTNQGKNFYDVEKHTHSFMKASELQMEIYDKLCERRKSIIG